METEEECAERRAEPDGGSAATHCWREPPVEELLDQMEQEDGVRSVQQEARQMVAHRVEAPDDVIGAEGHPAERLVGLEVEGREHPSQLRPAEPAVGFVGEE